MDYGACRAAIFSLLLLGTHATADEFNFEIAVDFDANRFSSTAPIFIGPLPAPLQPPNAEEPSLALDSDSDTTNIAGTWYFSGANDESGPLSRAPFVSRASSLSVAYARTAVSTSSTINPPLQVSRIDDLPPDFVLPPLGVVFIQAPPPTDTTVAPDDNFDGDDYRVSGRHVWQQSGWYVFGAATFSDGQFANSFGLAIEEQQYVAGAGYYLGEMTTIDIAVLRREVDIEFIGLGNDDSSTDYAMSIRHIGAIGSRWQYGADVAVTTEERANSDGRAFVRGSLYPTNAIAFGLEFETPLDDLLQNRTRYSAFGSWFVTPQFEIFGRAGFVDLDNPPAGSADEDTYGLGLRARF